MARVNAMGVAKHSRSVTKAEAELFVWPPRVEDGDIIVWLVDESRAELAEPGPPEGCELVDTVSGRPVPWGIDEPWGMENSTCDRSASVEQDRDIGASRRAEPRLCAGKTLAPTTASSFESTGKIGSQSHDSVDGRDTNDDIKAGLVSSVPALEQVRRRDHSGVWFLGAAVGAAMLFGTWSVGNRYQVPVRSPERAGPATAPPSAPTLKPAIAADKKHEPEAMNQAGHAQPAARVPGNVRVAAVRSPTIVIAPPIASTSTLVASAPALVTPPVTAMPESREAEAPTTVGSVRATPAPSPKPAEGPAPSSVEVPEVLPKTLINEQASVQRALQRYRAAYDQLDAGSVQAVWPAVNRRALARAFEALSAQAITFDRCDVKLQARITATAVCRGSVMYVPKVGNHDPRIESRVWNFSLRQADTDWTIDTARVER